MSEEKKAYGIKGHGMAVVVTLPDKSLNAFAEASKELAGMFGDKTILLMQTIDKPGHPLQVVIVFEWQ